MKPRNWRVVWVGVLSHERGVLSLPLTQQEAERTARALGEQFAGLYGFYIERYHIAH